jgi:type II secretory pathway pseudopilin PulG
MTKDQAPRIHFRGSFLFLARECRRGLTSLVWKKGDRHLAGHIFHSAELLGLGASPLFQRVAIRRGLTIFELIIVLGIISMAMAMAWPAFEEMFSSRRLSDAGTLVRNHLREARRSALSDSLTYRFDYSPHRSLFRIVPGDDPFEDDLLSEVADPATGEGKEEAVFEPLREKVELPDGVRVIGQAEFDEGPVGRDENSGAGSDDVARSALAGGQEQANEETGAEAWVPLVAFFPDGSATRATVRLVTRENRLLELYVEPMTGEVTIGEVDRWMSESDRQEEDEARELGLSPSGSSPSSEPAR